MSAASGRRRSRQQPCLRDGACRVERPPRSSCSRSGRRGSRRRSRKPSTRSYSRRVTYSWCPGKTMRSYAAASASRARRLLEVGLREIRRRCLRVRCEPRQERQVVAAEVVRDATAQVGTAEANRSSLCQSRVPGVAGRRPRPRRGSCTPATSASAGRRRRDARRAGAGPTTNGAKPTRPSAALETREVEPARPVADAHVDGAALRARADRALRRRRERRSSSTSLACQDRAPGPERKIWTRMPRARFEITSLARRARARSSPARMRPRPTASAPPWSAPSRRAGDPRSRAERGSTLPRSGDDEPDGRSRRVIRAARSERSAQATLKRTGAAATLARCARSRPRTCTRPWATSRARSGRSRSRWPPGTASRRSSARPGRARRRRWRGRSSVSSAPRSSSRTTRRSRRSSATSSASSSPRTRSSTSSRTTTTSSPRRTSRRPTSTSRRTRPGTTTSRDSGSRRRPRSSRAATSSSSRPSRASTASARRRSGASAC